MNETTFKNIGKVYKENNQIRIQAIFLNELAAVIMACMGHACDITYELPRKGDIYGSLGNRKRCLRRRSARFLHAVFLTVFPRRLRAVATRRNEQSALRTGLIFLYFSWINSCRVKATDYGNEMHRSDRFCRIYHIFNHLLFIRASDTSIQNIGCRLTWLC